MQDLTTYPMGPKVRAYLRFAAEPQEPGDADHIRAEALTAHLQDWHADHAASLSIPQVVDLLDELVAMSLPQAALDLAVARPDAIRPDDFRAHLALGIAAMVAGELPEAEERLRAAQGILPQEPAPYVNLAQIFLSEGRLEEAEVWCLAGLDAEPNNFHIWDVLGLVLRERHGEFLPEALQQLAEKRCSWAGLALAANLTTTGDRYFKANLLERLYHLGERDQRFLVELTGAYGVAAEFARIPPLVWQAESMTTHGLPWELHVHCAQAHLALNEPEAALQRLAKARRDPELPAEADEALRELEAEANEARTLLH